MSDATAESTVGTPADANLQPTLRGSLVHVRPLRRADFDALYGVASDPLMWEQHFDSERWREPRFRMFFEDAMTSGAALLVLDAATDEVIGTSRYKWLEGPARELEIGWTFLARKHWGGGYNGELKRLMLDHAFTFVDHVVFLVTPGNRRSRRALEKIGAVQTGVVPTPGHGEALRYVVGRGRVPPARA